ncbi:MAG: RNA polymerase sigma factor [Phycisphaerales bacterium]|nr:MAG: RNA polymerase sigma factor [Phycisphaerales bacterium]
MDDNVGFVQLIRQAQQGNQQSMSRLAEAAEGRLFPYIYRLTLNHDLAQDLLQETLLKMVESLDELKHADRFWVWLFRTALGQVQHHFRAQSREHLVQMSALSRERLAECLSQNRDDGLNDAMRKELSEAIFRAIARLRIGYRNVLILRCFEQMSYAEIATVMECKELRARVLFFRAKHSLSRQLSQRGFSKAVLLVALGLFGLATAPAKGASAAGAVTSASLDVGLFAALVGAAGTRLGIAFAGAAAALLVSLTLEEFLIAFVFFCFASICFVTALYTEW